MTSSMVAVMRAVIKAAISAASKAAAAGGSSYTTTAAGRYSLSQLEALWDQAGGNPAAAYNMARIAIAESGGNPNAYNPSGATGLWQILGAVVGGNLYSPLVNARNAVAKYNASGFYPWISDPVAAGLIGQGITRARGGPVARFGRGGTVWEPVTGYGHRTGRVYQFAEHAPETVMPGTQGGGSDMLDELKGLRAEVRELTGVARAIPRGTGEHLGAALGGVGQQAAFRRRYPAGGA